MTPEEFVDEILTGWTNVDDRVALFEPTLDTIRGESWRIEFENGDVLRIVVTADDG